MFMAYGDTDTVDAPGVSITPDVPHTFEYSSDGTTLEMKLDGVSVGTTPITSPTTLPATAVQAYFYEDDAAGLLRVSHVAFTGTNI